MAQNAEGPHAARLPSRVAKTVRDGADRPGLRDRGAALAGLLPKLAMHRGAAPQTRAFAQAHFRPRDTEPSVCGWCRLGLSPSAPTT